MFGRIGWKYDHVWSRRGRLAVQLMIDSPYLPLTYKTSGRLFCHAATFPVFDEGDNVSIMILGHDPSPSCISTTIVSPSKLAIKYYHGARTRREVNKSSRTQGEIEVEKVARCFGSGAVQESHREKAAHQSGHSAWAQGPVSSSISTFPRLQTRPVPAVISSKPPRHQVIQEYYSSLHLTWSSRVPPPSLFCLPASCPHRLRHPLTNPLTSSLLPSLHHGTSPSPVLA